MSAMALMSLTYAPTSTANTTFATRANSAVGSQSAAVSGGTRYFSYQFTSGRSYHAYGYIGYGPDSQGGSCSVTILDSTGAAVANNGGDEEPLDPGADGDGFVVPTAPAGFFEYNVQLTAGTATTCFLRVVETTLFSPWFFRDAPNGYDGFAEVHNNSRNTISATVTAFAPNGTIIGASTQSIPGNGTIFVTASSLGAANTFGSMTITTPAKPGSISANMTTISSTTGLSFDSPFTPRELVPRY